MINLQYSTIQNSVPDFIYDDIRSFLTKSNIYHPQPLELIQVLSKKYDLPEEYLFISAGSDESIMALKREFNNSVSYFPPTYVEYAVVDKITPSDHFHPVPLLDIERYSIDTKTQDQKGLIFLANPNNPYGYTSKKKILELAENNPSSIVVVDEAYCGFLGESVIDQVLNMQNLVVLRSFSKDYALAGMRIGFIAAPPPILEKIKKHVQETNVSYVSVGAALSALSHQAYYDALIEEVVKRRESFVRYLDKKQIEYLDSKINVTVLKFSSKVEAQALFNHLSSYGIVTSYGNGYSNIGLSDSHIRITIGSKDQMNAVEHAIDSHLKEER